MSARRIRQARQHWMGQLVRRNRAWVRASEYGTRLQPLSKVPTEIGHVERFSFYVGKF